MEGVGGGEEGLVIRVNVDTLIPLLAVLNVEQDRGFAVKPGSNILHLKSESDQEDRASGLS